MPAGEAFHLLPAASAGRIAQIVQHLYVVKTCTRLDADHDLRARTSGGLHQVEIHIVVDGNLTVSEGHRIAKTVESCLVDEIEDLNSIIVHVDPAPHEKSQKDRSGI